MEADGITTLYDPTHAAWIIQLHGEHDLSTADRLKRKIADRLDRKCRLVVDLTEATFIDSAIVGVLVRAAEYAQELGGRAAIASAEDSEPRRVIDLLGLPEELAGYVSREVAARAVYYATCPEPRTHPRRPGSPLHPRE